MVRDNGDFRYNGSQSSYSASWQTSGDVIGVKIDLDNSTIGFFKNGIYQGDAKTDLPSVTYHPYVHNRAGAPSSSELHVNFGQKPFKFPPPAGFQPLALANTPRPSIVRPDQYVGVTTYTGTGSSGQIITGLNFQSDLIWIKSRTGVYNHRLFDSVRGFGSGKAIYPDDTVAEGSYSVNDGVLSTNINGWTFTTAGARVNDATNYVAWCWKAGGNSNTFNINDVGYDTASATGLTAGTITPTGASVNTKSGFSIVSYTANSDSTATIGHGLGKELDFIIVKNRDYVQNWYVYHSSLGPTYRTTLNSTAASFSVTGVWNGTAPSSTVFSTVQDPITFQDGDRHIAYCWAEIEGFSKFGSYESTGTTNGPYVDLGFRPAVVLIKNADRSGEEWVIFDNERGANKYNPTGLVLYANSSGTEYNGNSTTGSNSRNVDFLSNGFKINDIGNPINWTGVTETHIFAAFAETPSFNLYGGQSNAR
jgi:hypothetical protein